MMIDQEYLYTEMFSYVKYASNKISLHTTWNSLKIENQYKVCVKYLLLTNPLGFYLNKFERAALMRPLCEMLNIFVITYICISNNLPQV